MKQMTKKIKRLLKAKELIEKRVKLNNGLMETIKILKQDEKIMKDENEAYKIALKLIKEDLIKEYRK